ncbi:hypothetical protein EsDP_00003908 [Epichloe bromicola]|uniref:Uncharacterized protein n=1 Tax=Epichloe bromicola TaxID=79588 RepID=A0ABQ0CQ69_9HYPO
MASSKAKDPLDALQLLVNDVLVQTGKALRASRRDSQGNLPPSYIQAKLPDTINAFHRALGSLERDIINAKSVILRDMNKLKTQNNSVEESQSLPQPQPVEAQSKSPMAIDLDSSPQAIPKEEPTDTNKITAIKPAAPFPDMGMGMGIPDSAAASITIKEENPPSHLPSATGAEGSSKVKTDGKQPTPAAPVPLMDAKLETNSSGVTGGDNVLELTNSDLNFTDMEFTLAPGNDNPTRSGGDGATAANLNGPSFDLGSFGTTNGATATMSLDNHHHRHHHHHHNNNNNNNNLPSRTVAQPAASTSGTGPAKTESQPSAEARKKEESSDAAFADIFAGDGQADGMDFDFSIGDGMGGDTFDDLMNDRDNTFDSMEHGDFDATFFGLDKADEA